MIDARIVEISRRLTTSKLEERRDSLLESLSQRLGDFSARGVGQSSMAVVALARVCAAEARAAVELAWPNIWRAALNVGVAPSGDLARELKAEIRAQTDEHYQGLMETLGGYQRRINVGVDASADITRAREVSLTQADAEVDLAVASLERRAEGEGGGSVYQFYAPVGAVVSGARASASVVQNIGAQEKADLTAALEGLAEAITRSAELRDESKGELIELVGEAQGELDRAKPNGLRLTSVLVGIGQAVQTIGSIVPAYQAVKAAAALFGTQLP